jgi:ComF family protein
MKYKGMFALTRPLADLMVDNWPDWAEPIDLVLPVPLHPKRERERGYNQAMLLVKRICSRLELEGDGASLWRNRYTRPQVGLNPRERLDNVRDAFAAERDRVKHKHILLVDDVYTTGATLTAAADTLLANGARAVSGYCLARAAGHS